MLCIFTGYRWPGVLNLMMGIRSIYRGVIDWLTEGIDQRHLYRNIDTKDI